jgi:hypothetical protein
MRTILLFSFLSIAGSSSAQQLSDSVQRIYTAADLQKSYLQKSSSNKALGYIFLGIGTAFTAGAIAAGQSASLDDIGSVTALAAGALVSYGLGIGKLSKGARYKGMASMIAEDPDPASKATLLRTYKNKATVNSILGWSVLAGGIVTTILVNTNGAEGDVERYGGIAISFASLPFFMSAGNAKGRVSILTRTERIASGNLQGAGTHRSIGIGIPISK